MTTPSTLPPAAPDAGRPATPAERPTVDGMLWLAFHRAVTVQAADLRRWLDRQTRSAKASGRIAELDLGRHVADLLETARCDLTQDDIRAMRTVVQHIRSLRAQAADCPADEADDLRWRLLALGYDARRAER